MLKFKLILLLIIFNITNLFAETSVRRCMLLPMTDNIDGAMAYKVFEDVESYLKESDWCIYRHNSEILNILSNYKQNLSEHLKGKDVLKLVAEKTSAGSLIRVSIKNAAKGVEVNLEIIGENGEDIYFKEQTALKNDDLQMISQTVRNWLDEYSKTIPYDGMITGVLGDQFSLDVGKQFGITEGIEVTIVRPIKKKSHPLLKEIVEWETEKIAEAKMFHSDSEQSQGKVTNYESKKRLSNNDWIIINKKKSESIEVGNTSTPEEEGNYGKLGTVSIYADVGKESLTTQLSSSSQKKYKGTFLGLRVNAEIWATREFWGGLDLARTTGKYKLSEGTANSSEKSSTNGFMKVRIGYKYLPLGFFYGPQVDGYGGYANYKYDVDTNTTDQTVSSSFTGFLLGVRGSMPFQNTFRPFLGMEFMLMPKYKEDVVVYGSADSQSNYSMTIGSQYIYNRMITFDAMLVHSSSSAKFKNSNKQVTFSETSLNFGATFTY